MRADLILKALEPVIVPSVGLFEQAEKVAREFGLFDHAVAAQELAKMFARDGRILQRPPFRGLVDLLEGA